jgi:hypothetical protein
MRANFPLILFNNNLWTVVNEEEIKVEGKHLENGWPINKISRM